MGQNEITLVHTVLESILIFYCGRMRFGKNFEIVDTHMTS